MTKQCCNDNAEMTCWDNNLGWQCWDHRSCASTLGICWSSHGQPGIILGFSLNWRQKVFFFNFLLRLAEILSSQHCHLIIVISTLSSRHCHLNVIISTLSSQRCHLNIVISKIAQDASWSHTTIVTAFCETSQSSLHNFCAHLLYVFAGSVEGVQQRQGGEHDCEAGSARALDPSAH